MSSLEWCKRPRLFSASGQQGISRIKRIFFLRLNSGFPHCIFLFFIYKAKRVQKNPRYSQRSARDKHLKTKREKLNQLI
jgi:hypothetical protein